MGGVKHENKAYFQRVLRLIQELGITNVEIFENPTNQKVREELARTRFFIFPAINEHFGMATVEAIASGAIPYVHDSGGQREIVTDSRLRFEDQDFFKKFEQLNNLPLVQLNLMRKKLNNHIQQFSEENFYRGILQYLDSITRARG
jgi:glycosyltransferase involved in cell wall biosynthesis